MSKTSTRAFTTLQTAADAGNKDAAAAIEALVQAAADVQHHGLSGQEYGRAEARRRFGPRPGDAA